MQVLKHVGRKTDYHLEGCTISTTLSGFPGPRSPETWKVQQSFQTAPTEFGSALGFDE